MARRLSAELWIRGEVHDGSEYEIPLLGPRQFAPNRLDQNVSEFAPEELGRHQSDRLIRKSIQQAGRLGNQWFSFLPERPLHSDAGVQDEYVHRSSRASRTISSADG